MLLLLIVGCGEKTDPVTEAREACKARYDNVQRWIIRHQRFPGTHTESREAAIRTEKDPWGNDYVTETIDAEVVVWSPGPDGEPGNADDISFPPGR